MFLKTLQKLQKNIFAGVFFLTKIQARGLQLYYKEAPLMVLFCIFCEIFKNTYFGTLCERLLLRVRSLRVSFRKVSGVYCVDDYFIYISSKFPANLLFLRMYKFKVTPKKGTRTASVYCYSSVFIISFVLIFEVSFI